MIVIVQAKRKTQVTSNLFGKMVESAGYVLGGDHTANEISTPLYMSQRHVLMCKEIVLQLLNPLSFRSSCHSSSRSKQALTRSACMVVPAEWILPLLRLECGKVLLCTDRVHGRREEVRTKRDERAKGVGEKGMACSIYFISVSPHWRAIF